MSRDGQKRRGNRRVWGVMGFLALILCCLPAPAAEHVTLKNGFEIDCVRREVAGERVRLYSDAASYLEVAGSAIARVEAMPGSPAMKSLVTPLAVGVRQHSPSSTEIHSLLEAAGARHHIDAEMLASVVKAESGGQVRAVSRTGARGLMQLMPGTATQLGVADSFRAEDNIAGGTAYLDSLLTRYHDDVALALAAYNAGPGAVDRWHGIPPYRETRAYVARVIREFNRRKSLAMNVPAR